MKATFNDLIRNLTSLENQSHAIDDYVCNAALAAYGSCYFENNCRNGKVGKIIFWYLTELCESSQALYPMEKPPYSLTSAKVLTVDELFSNSVQLSM